MSAQEERPARIHLRREKTRLVDPARAYVVALDGSEGEVDRIRNGAAMDLEVSPGRHEVQLRIDWCRSRPQKVDLGAGDVADLVCRSAPLWAVPYKITLGRDNYIALERTASTRDR
jgi:hypothetical protein